MAASVPLQVAETIQTAHINRQPSPAHDINPSTAASRKGPVKLEKYTLFPDDGIDEDSGSEDEDEFSFSILRPKSRRTQFPPMPDLRYEQSYLHSIRTADTWWKVVLITTRDQVMMPFMQGTRSSAGQRSERGSGGGGGE
ncbi:hypothetical protein OQA88_171 [Cercophora sp. LCS_1]